jgi:acyl-CoA thioester hydrolase
LAVGKWQAARVGHRAVKKESSGAKINVSGGREPGKDILTGYHTVASYEMDSFGHVNNAVFLNYLEKARCDFMELKGMQFSDFFKWRRYPVVKRARLDYKRPVRAGDRLEINGWISNHTQTSFTLQYEIIDTGSGQAVLTGETFHVFINDNNRPSRIPREFFEKFIAPGEKT